MNVSAEERERLARTLAEYNQAYRAGQPLVSDAEYDELTERLRALAPEHPFLHQVEPEFFSGRREVRHPAPMLSTEKAYTPEELARFVARIEREAAHIGVKEIRFRVTPKLDGLAGRDDGNVFVTRGDGLIGYEVSSAFTKGMIPVGGRGQGLGEMVLVKSYFDAHLSGKFEHPRNVVVGIVASETVNDEAKKALQDGAVRFVPYSTLPSWQGTAPDLLTHLDEISADLRAKVDYPLDGMVVEVLNGDLRAAMGATEHHHRWQIAVKRKGETAWTRVEEVHWQVGRTGKVTPVLFIEPVNLSGATIQRVSAHHAGFVEKKGLGPGAELEVIRSGEVIPKVESVLTPAHVDLPTQCPCCQSPLKRENDFLLCVNPNCPDQHAQAIEHWFKTLGNASWFGRKTVDRLVESGFDSLEKVYAMEQADFLALGFGPLQSANLAEALRQSRITAIEDWRFLAALGIENLGKGMGKRLLEHFRLEELPQAAEAEIASIEGFGVPTARNIVEDIKQLEPTLKYLLALGFTIVPSAAQAKRGILAGKKVVFTGKMQRPREEMEREAADLGAAVQSAVSAKTDFLVCGAKAGAAKTGKARKLGVRVISEEEYLQLIAKKD